MNVGGIDVRRELTAVSRMDVLHKPYINSAYATGSVLAGIGTPTSDIDVILLVASCADKEAAKRDKALRRHGSVRTDFEVFTVDEFAEAVSSCADYQTVYDAGRIYHIAQAIALLSQFTAAAQVLKPSAELAEFSNRIATQRAALVHLSVARAVIFGNIAHEDLLGFIEDEDEVGALRRSHDHLEFGLDAWCTSRGAIYPDENRKWLWRRLNLVLRSEREMATLRALYVPESPDEPIADVALRRLDTAQGLLAQSLLAAWAPHPEVFAVPALTRWTAPGETLWRSSRWMPTRSPHAWGIGEDSHFYEMPVTAAIAWAYAGGRTISELEGIVVDHCRAAFGIRVRAATVHSVVSRLLDFGAIRSGSFPPPASGGTAA